MEDIAISALDLKVHHQILSIQLSWNCNAACRQCMVSGSNERSRVMSLAEASRIIDQLERLPLTRFVGFTGGEAFLHYDLLLQLGRYIQEKFGYCLGVATNCFWAEDRARAREMLSSLAALGLTELLVSLDDFHLEFVRAKCVENCLREALALGINITVQTIRSRTGHDAAWFQKNMDVPRPPAVRWVETPLHPAGRAVHGVPASEYVYDWTNCAGYCTALRVWSVDPYGWVTPCCGTAFSHRLRVGNALQEDLAAIVNRANVDVLLNTLAGWGGPYLLIKTLEQNGDYRFSNREFASHCHACDTVLRDRQALGVFERELPPHWIEAVASRLAAHTLWYRCVVDHDPGSDWLPAGWLPAREPEAPADGPLSTRTHAQP